VNPNPQNASSLYPNPPNPPPDKDAIAAVVDLLKLETSLATGVLAFSIGLTTSTTVIYSADMKPWLIAGWVILAISIIFGVLGLFYGPALYTNPKLTIYSGEVRVATMANQVGFVFGSAFVGVVLVLSLNAGPSRNEGSVRTPLVAVRYATARVAKLGTIAKISTVELIKGTDASRIESAVWHVQFELKSKGAAQKTKTASSKTKPAPTENRTVDVYVDTMSPMTYAPALGP